MSYFRVKSKWLSYAIKNLNFNSRLFKKLHNMQKRNKKKKNFFESDQSIKKRE